MHPRTGKIVELPPTEKPHGLIPLSRGEARRLSKLPLAARGPTLVVERAAHPLAQLPGMTKDDVKQIRNAMKRARRARRIGEARKVS